VRTSRLVPCGIALLALAVVPVGSQQAAQTQQTPALRVEVPASEVTLRLGEQMTLTAVVRNAAGALVEDATLVFSSSNRRQLAVEPSTGVMEATEPGTYTVTITAVPAGGAPGVVEAEGAAAVAAATTRRTARRLR
jgi:hypothetical protein